MRPHARRTCAPTVAPAAGPAGILLFTAAAVLLLVTVACAAPTLGFRESFPGTSSQGWGGGLTGAVISNPGTGGVAGTGDGYLQIVTGFPTNWGSFATAPAYSGDWIAAGVTQMRLQLSDIGPQNPLEVHFAIGNTGNLWQYDVGFVPPPGAWGLFVVDLTNAGAFTQTIGLGTFQQALQAVDRVHFRHDLVPFVQGPDPIQVDGGIDDILLTNGVVGVEPGPPTVIRPLRLAPPYPNPSRGPVTLEFESATPGPLRMQAVDIAGRVVRETRIEAAQAGSQRWLWDGRDDRGLRLAPGRSRVRLFGAAGGMSQPIVIVR